MEYVLFSHPILQHIGHSKPGFGAVSSSFFRGKPGWDDGLLRETTLRFALQLQPTEDVERAGAAVCAEGIGALLGQGLFDGRRAVAAEGSPQGPRSPGGRLSAGVQRRIFSSRDWKPLITTRSVAQHASASGGPAPWRQARRRAGRRQRFSGGRAVRGFRCNCNQEHPQSRTLERNCVWFSFPIYLWQYLVVVRVYAAG